jgi:hypothetical protein
VTQARPEGGFRHWNRSVTPPLAAALLTGLAYWSTVAPSIVGLDSPELIMAARRLGFAHSPGYVVYLIALHLFQGLPLGDLAHRSNLFSAVCAATGAAVLVAVGRRFTRQALPALIGSLSLGFCYYMWSVAVMTEVYAFQSTLLLVAIFFLLRWRDRGTRRDLAAATFTVGIAVANNPATMIWWPGLACLALLRPLRRAMTTRVLVGLPAVFALGLLPLLYYPLRSAAGAPFSVTGVYGTDARFRPTDLSDFSTLIWFLSGGPFRHLAFGYSLAGWVREWGRFGQALWAAFLGVGLPLGAWGLHDLWKRDRATASGLLLIAVAHTVFFVGYRALDKEIMFLPVFVIWAIFLATGVARLARRGPGWLTVVFFLLPLGLYLVNRPLVDLHDNFATGDRARLRLETALPDAVYLAPWSEAAAMAYCQMTDGLRQDVRPVDSVLTPPDTLALLIETTLLSGRPVYAAAADAHLKGQYRLIECPEGYQVTWAEGP